jgi:hypothetical protein
MNKTSSSTIDRWAKPGKHYTGRCYLCQFRRDIPGSVRSGCAVLLEGPREAWSLRISFEGNAPDEGWADWPFVFDPLWLRFCDAFRKKN